jgi:hypothetical protein
MRRGYRLIPLFILLCLAGRLGAKEGIHLRGAVTGPFLDEQVTSVTFQPDVKVYIDALSVDKFDPAKPTRLILYALPNGNTISQTWGKKMRPGLDWHYGIQHIGAQTRRLREIVADENIVVALLEAKGRSWPTWRGKHPDKEKLLTALVQFVRAHIPVEDVTIEISGHSGGGSLLFGYLNSVDNIPDGVRRLSFLDSNYSYSDEAGHGDKILKWLNARPDHILSIICYDDRNVKFNGKLIVGPNEGTWRKTLKMLERFQRDVKLEKVNEGAIIHYRGLNGRIDIIMYTNPENKILHTSLIGDMNGFIYAMTLGTKYEGKAGHFGAPVDYEKWIQPE